MPDVSGEQKTQQELAELRAERDQLRAREALQQRAHDSSHGFIDPALTARLLEHQVVIKNGVLVGKDGRTVETILADFAEKSPYTTKAFHQSRGSSAQTYTEPQQSGPSDSDLAKLFGKGSNASAANKLALADPTKYHQYKALAKERGIINW
jgi:hypothetical protein